MNVLFNIPLNVIQLVIVPLNFRSINASQKNSIQNLKSKLVSCIRHHQYICEFLHIFEQTFSLVFLMQFFVSLFMFGLVGFQVTVTKEYSRAQLTINFYCVCILLELFLFCYLAHQIIDAVRSKMQLRSQLYCHINIFWFFHSGKSNSSINILQCVVQMWEIFWKKCSDLHSNCSETVDINCRWLFHSVIRNIYYGKPLCFVKNFNLIFSYLNLIYYVGSNSIVFVCCVVAASLLWEWGINSHFLFIHL